MDKGDIIGLFPKLKDDDVFQSCRMSPEDDNYNCIAWAYQMFTDRWMQPPKGVYIPVLDAVSWWPNGVHEGNTIEYLVEAFTKKGFQICKTWEHEEGFVKVALYYKPKEHNKWTHAARESRSGNYWMSKLGSGNDIHHKNPYTIEGDAYGEVYCIMKMSE